MQITKPAYYDAFRCLAGACPDSCCQEWAVSVDPESAEYYRKLPGALGERLRQVLVEEDGDTVLAVENRRCPMWRSDGLCRIQAELGEQALCQVCRDFPRLRHDYGDFLELMLELSCPEAARLILNAPPEAPVVTGEPSGEGQYDPVDMEILLESRRKMLELLSDCRYSVGETLALAMLYGCQAQSGLDSGELTEFSPEASLETARSMARSGDMEEILAFYRGLEHLTPRWEALLAHPVPGSWDERYRALGRYFVERYWLQAISDLDLYSRVKFTVVSCLVIRHLGGELEQTAQLYSKEIENDWENVDALLDAAYTHPALTDDRVLGLLLRAE